MEKVNECILCSSKRLKKHKAIIASFIAERIWNKKSFGIELTLCEDCSFAFFNPRLGDDEIQALYNNYRDENYQQQRYKHEPFYTKEINELIRNNDVEIINRKKNLFKFLSDYTNTANIKSVLDFGGDQGQAIIDEFSHIDRYVFDISGADPINSNIIKINNYSECKKNSYDFIMCCHV